jgi:hypothetical protein
MHVILSDAKDLLFAVPRPRFPITARRRNWRGDAPQRDRDGPCQALGITRMNSDLSIVAKKRRGRAKIDLFVKGTPSLVRRTEKLPNRFGA